MEPRITSNYTSEALPLQKAAPLTKMRYASPTIHRDYYQKLVTLNTHLCDFLIRCAPPLFSNLSHNLIWVYYHSLDDENIYFGVLNGFNCMASILDMTFIYSQRLPNKMASPHNNYDNNGIPTPCRIPAALSTCHHIQEHCNIYPIHKTNAQLSCKYNTPIHTVF